MLSHTYARFIPAYAGNSWKCSAPALQAPVHPRLRGELGALWRPNSIVDRFIPAYAGNSSDEILITANHYGSSPLTRGTPPSMSVPPETSRFIPAYAGNSIDLELESKEDAVHPRLRGEL